MTALVITHAEVEGPGLLSTWLVEAGLGLTVVEPWNGDRLPTSLEGYEALVVMGGPQDAYDDSTAPWLADTKKLLREAVDGHVPVLGVCLGAQLLAMATGGFVAPGDKPELGVRLVGKRDASGSDPLMWDLPLSPVVIQWHWDGIDELPPGATLLMSSTAYPHQAFRVGPSAWGLQFHVETDEPMLREWVTQVDGGDALLEPMLAELEEIGEVWGEVIRRFARFALER